jgi:hemerythrin
MMNQSGDKQFAVVNKKKRKSENVEEIAIDQHSSPERVSSVPVDASFPKKAKKSHAGGDEASAISGKSVNLTADGGEQPETERKMTNKELKKLKRKKVMQKKKSSSKKRKQQKSQENAVNEQQATQRHREFASDLENYLSLWEDSKVNDGTGWKFNKVLQEWALQHCLEKDMISPNLFKKLIPYAQTVHGKARDRLCERLNSELTEESNGNGGDNSAGETESASETEEMKLEKRKRAKKLISALSSP